MNKCAKSPSGCHCPHSYAGLWASVDPPPNTCCFCGVDVNKEGHGEYWGKLLPETKETKRL